MINPKPPGEAYLRQSIEEPGARIVQGYPNVMPHRNLSGDDVDALITYIRCLSRTETPSQECEGVD